MWLIVKKKIFKTLDEQLNYLQNGKLVKFDDLDKARTILLNNNYYYLISCGKIKFAKSLDNRKYEYEASDFDEWVDYFNIDRNVVKHLRNNVLDFERLINSRAAYFVSQLMETGIANSYDKEGIKLIILSSKNVDGVNFSEYDEYETWKYVTKMMFGDMKKLIFWLLENKRSFYEKIVEDFSFLQSNDTILCRKRLNEINNLRNNLCHSTPLSNYLVYGKVIKGKLQRKIDVVKFVYRLYGKQSGFLELNQICGYARKFMKIKKTVNNKC